MFPILKIANRNLFLYFAPQIPVSDKINTAPANTQNAIAIPKLSRSSNYY